MTEKLEVTIEKSRWPVVREKVMKSYQAKDWALVDIRDEGECIVIRFERSKGLMIDEATD